MLQRHYHRIEAQNTIRAMVPAITDEATRAGISLGGAAEDDAVGLEALAVAPVGDGVVSPSALDALPRSELANSHNWRMLFTSEGKLGVSSTSV
jgi:hypothetical protein